MWKLVNEKGDIFILPIGRAISVSRKVGDLILAGDQSVSRDHAVLQVESSIDDGVSVQDTKSKFGTFINEGIKSQTKLNSEVKVVLKEGDKIRFGLQHNIWNLVREHLCVCSSSLTASERGVLAKILMQIGGKLHDKWTDKSSYLTMKSVTLTIKVVCALACGKPIVTPVFWESFKDAVAKAKGLPNITNFIPPLTDEINRNKEEILPNTARKTLFNDKVFVFPTAKHLQKFGCMVEFAGGKAIELRPEMSVTELSKPNVIVVHHAGPESDISSHYQKVVRELCDMNLRVIPEKDIGLAILDVTLEPFCNPSCKSRDLFLGVHKLESDSDLGMVIAACTEDVHVTAQLPQNSELSEDVKIPPTGSTATSQQADDTLSIQPDLLRKRSRESCVKSESSADVSALNSGSATMESSFFKTETQLGHGKSPAKEIGARNDPSPLNDQEKPAPQLSDQPSSSNTNINFKFNEDFILPSPPKASKRRKIAKTFDNSDDADMFDLPSRPTPSNPKCKIEEEDIFGFNDCSSYQRKIKNSLDHASINESRDIFDQSEDIFGSVKPSIKRKATYEVDEMADTPTKRILRDSENCLNQNHLSGFLSKSTAPKIKQEVHAIDLDSDAAKFAALLRDKIVMETVSLVVRTRRQPQHSSGSSGDSSKNFKKFRKAWKPPVQREIICDNGMQKESIGNKSLLNGLEHGREEENEDAPSVRPELQRTGLAGAEKDNEDDEWTFRPFSQI